MQASDFDRGLFLFGILRVLHWFLYLIISKTKYLFFFTIILYIWITGF
jgi:hypothetical protein